MGRDLTPRELYETEQWNVWNGRHDLWEFMEQIVMNYNGTSQKLHSEEEIALRRGFPFLGKLLNNFPDLHAKLSEIAGGVDLLHCKDEELGVYIETGEGDESSYLVKWFNGELDPNFHYGDYNDSLLYSSLLLETQLNTGKMWVCVYKDTLGYQDDNDNLTNILLPREWLEDQLRSEGVNNFGEWYLEYTADDTDSIARQALADGVILECEDKNIKLDCIPEVRALTEDDVEQVEVLDSESGNDVACMVDSEEYAWGIFVGADLVGYCTIGGADDTGHDEYETWTNESLCLSDVFVKPEHRCKGYASRLIGEALKHCNPDDKESVFITLLDDDLSDFYYSLGFKLLDNGVMVRERSKAPSLETQIGNAASINDKNASALPAKDEIER